jgi:Sec-independent protein secretion pathway component TatC
MSERPKRGFLVRGVAYPLLALAAAFLSPSPDVLTMFMVFVLGVLIFEAGYFVCRRWPRRGGR